MEAIQTAPITKISQISQPVSRPQTTSRALTTGNDEFINRIYEVKIPRFPKAYNATIIDDGEGYLMAFRYDDYRLPVKQPIIWSEYYQSIGFIRLNANFEPIGNWMPCKKIGQRAYDPRLFPVNDKIFLTYTSPLPEATNSVTSSAIYLTQIQKNENHITVDEPLLLKAPLLDNPFPTQGYEKNWVPFSYHDQPTFSYLINPHTVLTPSLEDGMCNLASIAKNVLDFDWDWGSIRGGTPALLVDGEYLAFFHSCKVDPITGIKIYYIGAYTFESHPPFNLTKISTKPFLHHDFYSSTPNHILTGHSASYVLFPGGFVVRDNHIYVCYGENDVSIKVMELNKNELYKSLMSISVN